MSEVTSTPVAATAPVEAVPAGKLTDAAMADSPAATPTAEVPQPEAVESEKVASKFAALSRKEKAIKAEERRVAAMKKEYEDKIAALQSQTIDAEKYIDVDSFKKNPYAAMKKYGLTLEQLAEIALNDGKVTPESLVKETETKLEAKIREMEQKLAAKDAAEAEAKIEQVLENFKTGLTKFVNDTADYEMIRAEEAHDLVYDVIEAHYEQKLAEYTEENGEEPDGATKNGFIMDNKKACDLVEKYLLDKEVAKINRAKQLSKTKGLFDPPAPAKVEPKVSAKATNTLTNTLSTQVPSSSAKMLTDEESKREASKLLKFID